MLIFIYIYDTGLCPVGVGWLRGERGEKRGGKRQDEEGVVTTNGNRCHGLEAIASRYIMLITAGSWPLEIRG